MKLHGYEFKLYQLINIISGKEIVKIKYYWEIGCRFWY